MKKNEHVKLRTTFMAKCIRYSERRDISLSKLSTLVLNDTKFFIRVLDGKSFTDKSYDSIMVYIADNPVRKRRA